MKRQAKANYLRRRRDVNLERAFNLGFASRSNDKPCTACPNLIHAFGESYGTELCDAWMRGWHAADQKLKEPRFDMKGAD